MRTTRTLKDLRRQRGLTQADVAEKIGYSKRTVERHEAGAPVKAAHLLAYAQIYSVNVEEITP